MAPVKPHQLARFVRNPRVGKSAAQVNVILAAVIGWWSLS